ncbi:DUF982 domain-containing protein [Rhizobium sp. Root1203]|uniref:DUF982 domain-containing protein n=1 Tax=Rhizobium sp. Root1203 TaxID=1736427 RepID=UPI0009E88197|nr:DUF982 domain-containing protein [Rhizobium sp. Root1203]
MDLKTWKHAVVFQTHSLGTIHTVKNTKAAAEWLLLYWPLSQGDDHSAAMEACLRVLEGSAPVEVAREAFIDACKEADIFVLSATFQKTRRQQNAAVNNRSSN